MVGVDVGLFQFYRGGYDLGLHECRGAGFLREMDLLVALDDFLADVVIR